MVRKAPVKHKCLIMCQLNWSRYCTEYKRKMDTPKFVPADWVKQELEEPDTERTANLKYGTNDIKVYS